MSGKDDSAGNETGTIDEQIDNQLRGSVNQAQGLANSIKRDLPPTHTRAVENLETDLEVLEQWLDDVEVDGVDALAGAPIVVGTAQLRIEHLQDKVGQGDPDLATRLEELEDTVEEIEDVVDDLQIGTTAYVTYVNRSFADRYFTAAVQISTLLIAGLDDEDVDQNVDDYGLFPMDSIYGDSVEDQAFPANREVDLGDDHRRYWESTSDGGKIA